MLDPMHAVPIILCIYTYTYDNCYPQYYGVKQLHIKNYTVIMYIKCLFPWEHFVDISMLTYTYIIHMQALSKVKKEPVYK